MSNLIPMEEAAKILGLSVEDLAEARSRGDVHAYRDGKTWKFKLQEVERYKAVLSDVTESNAPSDSMVRAGSSAIIDAELDELIDLGETSGLSLIDDVIDDAHVGVASSSSSTIIGKPKLADEATSDEVDLDVPASSDALSELKLEEGTDLLASRSALAPSEAQDEVTLDEEVDIGDSSELNLVESSIKLGDDSEVFAEAIDNDAAATGELGGGVAQEDEDMLLDAEEPELHLSDEDLELSLGSSSEISLDAGDLELAASDTGVGVTDGSDVTLDASGSGINLATPGDSGIALDQTPPELAMGGDEVLELGEAELVDLDEGLIEEDAMQADDDFLLSPSESDMGEGDSGSQVIALDTEELDDEAATLVRGEEAVEAYADDEQVAMAPIGVGAGVGEAPYSIANVLSLGLVMLPLGLTGLFMFDLVRNMWSWNGTYPLNSTIMDFILQMFG